MAELKEQGQGSRPQNPEWKHDFSPGPSEKDIKRFQGPEWRSELPDIKMELEEEDMAARGAEYYARKEEFASRDPILERLTLAQDPRDVAESLVILRNFEDFDKAEASSEWRLEQYSNACLIGVERFGRTHAQLVEEEIVKGKEEGEKGKIDAKGYLEEGSSVNKHGYAIRVERGPKETSVNGKKRVVIEEKFYFGTNEERRALARAFEVAADMFIIRERIHLLYKIFDDHKADLDGAVKLFFQRAPHLSNEIHQKIFRMPDISRIDFKKPETLNNQEFGERGDLAMRLLYVVGNCETKEKMEKLQATPGYERLRQVLQERLGTLEGEKEKKGKALTQEERDMFDLDKLVGRVKDWKTKDERDPSKGGKGAKVIEDEKKVRGELTVFGNVFAHESVDNEASVVRLIGEITGDPDAANVGHRIFKLWGLADELGMEQYSDYLPGAEEIKKWLDNVENGKASYEQWRKQAREWLKYFAVPGEPVSSDFSKLFWTHLWRLKDILKDRPSGPVYTVDKVERLCLSLPSLIRIETPYGFRSIREAWWGADGEEPRDLGEIEWAAITEPNKLIAEASQEMNKEDRPKDKPVRYGAWGLYTLFLFLAGEDNPIKRPWSFLNYEEYNPQDFLKNMFFTSKIKFLGITLNDLWRAEGNWRGHYARLGKLTRTKGDEDDDAVSDALKNEAEREIAKIKREYWKGVKSLPQWKMAWEGTELKLRSKLSVSPYLTVAAEELAKRFGFE